MTSPFTDVLVPNTRQPISPLGLGSKLESRGELFCPLPFRCSSLMFILQRCHTSGAKCEARQRRVDGRDTEPEKVKEDRKCFEWVRQRRRGGGKERKDVVRRESGCARLTMKGKKRERDLWRGCISGTSQANYPAPSPPFPSVFCSHFSLTFSISALTIHVLSTARDP